jgi:hypothetical protein
MTDYERKLKHMLNYYEVDTSNIKKDEKMSKKELTAFLDKFNRFLDYYILEDIISKIKGGSKSDDVDNEMENPFMDEFEDDFEEKDFFLPKDTPKDTNKKEDLPNDSLNDPIDGDVNKFLKWLTLILYTGEYTVIVNDDGKTIHIKLTRINNKGKK